MTDEHETALRHMASGPVVQLITAGLVAVITVGGGVLSWVVLDRIDSVSSKVEEISEQQARQDERQKLIMYRLERVESRSRERRQREEQ